MDSQTYLILLRVIHISFSIFWAGATIYLAAFVSPAVKALGPEGGKFMQQLARTNKLPAVMTLLSSLSIIAGALLLWELSDHFQKEWMGSRHGIILSTGAALALVAWLEGLFVTRPTVLRLNKLGQQVAAAAGPPTEEQAKKLNQYRKKIFSANNLAAILIAGAVIGMSLVRYL